MVREKVLAMKALWTEDEARFDGQHVHVEPSWALPKPVQRPQPGDPPGRRLGAEAVRRDRRVGRRVDADLGATVDRQAARPAPRAAAESAGRDPSSIAVSVFGATTDPAGLANLAAEGVTRVVLTLPYEDADVVLPILDDWAPLTGALDG